MVWPRSVLHYLSSGLPFASASGVAAPALRGGLSVVGRRFGRSALRSAPVGSTHTRGKPPLPPAVRHVAGWGGRPQHPVPSALAPGPVQHPTRRKIRGIVGRGWLACAGGTWSGARRLACAGFVSTLSALHLSSFVSFCVIISVFFYYFRRNLIRCCRLIRCFFWGFLCPFLRSCGPLSARVAWRPSPLSPARDPRPVSPWPSRFVVALAPPAFGVALVAPLAHTPRPARVVWSPSSSPSPVAFPLLVARLSPSRVACAPSPPWPSAWGWRFYESWLLWSLFVCPLSLLSPWSRRWPRGGSLCPLACCPPFLPLSLLWRVGACPGRQWRRSALLLLRHLWLHLSRPRPLPLASWSPVRPGAAYPAALFVLIFGPASLVGLSFCPHCCIISYHLVSVLSAFAACTTVSFCVIISLRNGNFCRKRSPPKPAASRNALSHSRNADRRLKA